MNFAMAGPAIILGLGCIGSAIGVGIAGMASHAVMSRVDDNHAKFIAMSAAPSSQTIFAFILMFLMKNAILANTLSPLSGIAIGIASGMALMISAIFQGKAAATGIQAVAKQPALFAKCFIALGIIESFALFAVAFSLLLLK